MINRQIIKLLLATLALCCVSTLAACNQKPEQENGQNPPPPIPDIQSLEADVTSTDPQRVATAFSHLSRAANLPAADNPERQKHRYLIATGFVDAWLNWLTLSALATAEDNPDETRRFIEEANQWADALGVLAYAAQPLGADPGPRSEYHWIASRLRGYLRPMLRDPELRNQARAIIAILDAAQFEDSANRLRAAEVLAADDSTRPFTHNLVLAAQALNILGTLQQAPRSQQSALLAEAVGHICSDGVAALKSPESWPQVRDDWRRRCGFACTSTSLLGLSQPTRMPPLQSDVHQSCGPEQMGLPDDTIGHYLALDNQLAISALAELQRIRNTLQSLDDDPLAERMQPFVDRYVELLDQLTVIGQLPFIAREGPNGLTLPLQYQVDSIVRPTQAVMVLQDEQLRLAAWPRFTIVAGKPRAVGDREWGYPGTDAHELSAQLDTKQVAAIKADLTSIRELPWPTGEDDDRAVLTLVIDARAPARQLKLAAAIAEEIGFSRLQIATWPREVDATITRPAPGGLLVRVDRPQRRAPRIALANGESNLFDTLGRATPIPMFAVQRFLPDVYAAIMGYARSNPAIRTLLVDPEDSLQVQTVASLLDALRFIRFGDYMASTVRLLEASPMEGNRFPVMDPIHLKHW